ncbi:hypothetical protein CRENBAI_014335, partial [Crenichthys baileyi]
FWNFPPLGGKEPNLVQEVKIWTTIVGLTPARGGSGTHLLERASLFYLRGLQGIWDLREKGKSGQTWAGQAHSGGAGGEFLGEPSSRMYSTPNPGGFLTRFRGVGETWAELTRFPHHCHAAGPVAVAVVCGACCGENPQTPVGDPGERDLSS